MNAIAYNKRARLTGVMVYAKLFTSIYQGTLRGNSHGLLVFTNLLAHCDKHGDVDMHPRAIAEEVGLTVEQVRAALLILESPDDESRSPEEQGRRIVRKDGHRDWGWNVVNYLKYRAIRDEDDRREQNRVAQERWRNRHKEESAGVIQGKPASAAVETNKPIQKQKQIQKEETNTPARKRAAAARLVSVSDLVAEGVEQQCAEDWLAARKVKNVPLTLTAWNQTKEEAAAAGMSIGAAIKTAAGNGWAGFKAKWLDDKPTGRRPAEAVTVASDEANKSAAYLAEQAEHARKAVAPPENIRALVRGIGRAA